MYIMFITIGNDVLPATRIAGLVSCVVHFWIACEEEMYIPLIQLMEGAEPIMSLYVV